MNVALIGAGTLSKLVIDIIHYQKLINITGIYDDTFLKGEKINGYPILGKIEDAFSSNLESVVICIGNQTARKELYNKFEEKRIALPNIIAHNAIVSTNAIVEYGCIIGFFSTVLYDTVIGKGSCILNNVSINHNTRIGNFALIGVGALIGNDSILEEGVHIGMGKTILPSTKVTTGQYIH